MNEKIKRVVIETCCWIILLVIILFFVTYISFSNSESSTTNSTAFKDAWYDSIAFFAALSTLGAAIVAAYLVNSWKDQASYQTNKEISMKVNEVLSSVKFELGISSEILFNLDKITDYAVLNTEYLEFGVNDLTRELHKISPNINYLFNKVKDLADLKDQYVKLERNHRWVIVYFNRLQDKYLDYYNNIIKISKLNSSIKYYGPYKAYQNKNDPMIVSEILSLLYSFKNPVGYYLYDENKDVKFKNLQEMIKETIDIIENIQDSLIKNY